MILTTQYTHVCICNRVMHKVIRSWRDTTATQYASPHYICMAVMLSSLALFFLSIIHFLLLIWDQVVGAAAWTGKPGLPSPSHFNQLFWGNAKPFSSQPGDIVSPSMSKIVPGASPWLDMFLGTPHQGATREASLQYACATSTGSSEWGGAAIPLWVPLRRPNFSPSL